MTVPSPADKLNALQPAGLAQVINDLMIRLYSPDATIQSKAFSSLVDFGIWDAESPLNAFERIYQGLSDTGKSTFRSALGLALCQTRPDAYPAAGVRDLIYLIGYTEAFESLGAISSVLADASNWEEAAREFFFNALAVLKGLGKSPLAYDACRRLVTSAQFPANYIFDAYETLVLGSPVQWADNLLYLSERMLQIKDWQPAALKGASTSWYESRLQSLANDVLGTLSLRTLCDGLVRFENSPNYIDKNQPAGKILFDLLCNDGPFQLVSSQTEGVQIFIRGTNVKELWPADMDSTDTYLWSVGIEPDGSLPSVPILSTNDAAKLHREEPEIAKLLANVFSRDEYKHPYPTSLMMLVLHRKPPRKPIAN